MEKDETNQTSFDFETTTTTTMIMIMMITWQKKTKKKFFVVKKLVRQLFVPWTKKKQESLSVVNNGFIDPCWNLDMYDYFNDKHYINEETAYRQQMLKNFFFCRPVSFRLVCKSTGADRIMQRDDIKRWKVFWDQNKKSHNSIISNMKPQSLNVTSLALIHNLIVYMFMNLAENSLTSLEHCHVQGKYLYSFIPLRQNTFYSKS